MLFVGFIRAGLTWGCLFGLYLVLTGQTSVDEVIAGLATAAVATALSVLVRRSSGHLFRLKRLVWLPAVCAALKAVPGEVVIVAARFVSVHPTGGDMQTEPLEAEDATGQALQIVATSFAPNRYVISPVKGGQLLLHRLVMPGQRPEAP
jgi:hypothetical protein